MALIVNLVLVSFINSAVSGKTAEEWKSRIIYQLLTDRFAKVNGDDVMCTDLRSYCGGTFKGIMQKLDYIQGLGMNAIWISPVVENTPGGYHGYWAKNIYNINPYYGTADDLKALVTECHKRDIWVMVDVVANHMGYPPGCFWDGCTEVTGTNFTGLTPFNKTEYYHDYCQISNWNNQTEVENCRLAYLPDLNQDNTFVRHTLLKWIADLTVAYDFDGIRIDTASEMPRDFWEEFSNASGVFQMGEVANSDPDYVAPYQGPMSAVLNFPMFYSMKKAFQEEKSLNNVKTTLSQEAKLFRDMSVLGGFIDNHDQSRFLGANPDWTALQNAIVFTMFARWIPIIYYGTEQGYNGSSDPLNRESLWPNYNTSHPLYQFISKITKFRTMLGADLLESNQTERMSSDSVYVYTRCTGDKLLIVTTNAGSGVNIPITIINLPYQANTVLRNILNESDTVTSVDNKVTIQIDSGQPKIYYVTSTGEVTGSVSRTTKIYYITTTTILTSYDPTLVTFDLNSSGTVSHTVLNILTIVFLALFLTLW